MWPPKSYNYKEDNEETKLVLEFYLGELRTALLFFVYTRYTHIHKNSTPLSDSK